MVYKFCVTFKDCIWYLEKTLQDVIEALDYFDLDQEMLDKWKVDLFVYEKSKQFKEVSTLIENYF